MHLSESEIKKIHASNDAIRGEEISAKIAKMEQVIEQIFQRAEEHPEIIPNLKKMMDYYLPPLSVSAGGEDFTTIYCYLLPRTFRGTS